MTATRRILGWPLEKALFLLWRGRLYTGPYWRRSLAAWALPYWYSVGCWRERDA